MRRENHAAQQGRRAARWNRSLLVVGAFCLGVVVGLTCAPKAGGVTVESIRIHVEAKQQAIAAKVSRATERPAPVAIRRAPPRAPAPVAPLRAQGTWGGVQQRIADTWPGDDAKALRVSDCETGGFRRDVVYGPRTGAAGERGALQIHPGWFDGRWGSPEFALAGFGLAAWHIFSRYGWGKWTCGGA